MVTLSIPYLIIVVLRWTIFLVFNKKTFEEKTTGNYMSIYQNMLIFNYSIDMLFSMIVTVATPVIVTSFLRKMKQKHRMIYETHKKRYIL